MKTHKHKLKNNCNLIIRNVELKDVNSLIDYIEHIANESDFLSFGHGELRLSKTEEEHIINKYLSYNNKLYLIGLIDDMIVTTLNYSGGNRPRTQHSGEFGLSVRKKYWGFGIGSMMLYTLIDWANDNQIIKKINLRVRLDNQRAIQLFKRKGFIIEGTIRKEIIINGNYFDHYWMGLEL